MTDTLIATRGIAITAPAAATQEKQFQAPAPAVAPQPGWRQRLVRFAILGAVVAALGTTAAVVDLRAIADSVVALGPGAAVAVAVVGGLLLSVLVPRTAITLACGALLGPAVGAVASLAAAAIAAIATYYAGRWAGRGALGARNGSRMERLDGWLNRRGLSAVLLVRFLPLAPYGLIGYAYGTTSVCRHRYLWGTIIAAIPSSISYAVLGAAVSTPGSMNPWTLAPALVGIGLTSGIVYRWRRNARRAALTTPA